MRARLITATLLAAFALGGAHADAAGCGGLLQPRCPPPPPAPPPAAPPTPPAATRVSVTLKPKLAAQRWHDAVSSGEPLLYRGHIDGQPAPGVEVELELRAPDYGNAQLKLGYELVATTDEHGDFSTAIAAPPMTVHIRAVIAPGQSIAGHSKDVTLHIAPQIDFYVRPGDPRPRFTFDTYARRTFAVVGSSAPRHSRRGAASHVYVYSVARGARYAYLAASAKLGASRCKADDCYRHAEGTISLTTRVRHARSLLACTRGKAYLGVGYSAPRELCGARRVPAG